MKKIKIMKIMEKAPLFTFNEFVRFTEFSPGYAKVYLSRLKKDGMIFEIERGKYSIFDDPFLFSSYIIMPSYISFWTALKFYGFTEQLPSDIMVACAKPRKPINFRGVKILFFKTKNMWGYKKQRFGNFEIIVAEKEKAIIDSLALRNIPFDEIAKSIETKDFDAQKLLEYAEKTKNISLKKRLGFLLENFGISAEKLSKSLDNNYIPLDWHGKKRGSKNKKWKIIVNRRFDAVD